MPQPTVALITGASKGLGAELCRQLLEDGQAVATFSRSRTDAIATFERRAPERFLWTQLDVADFEGTAAFVRTVVDRFGRIDTLVNNAGTMQLGTLPMMTKGNVRSMISVNLEGPIHLMRACSRQMVHQRSGCIVNVSTVNALRGYRGVSVYAATKAGVDAMTRSLARELGSRGIRVNSVACGFFESDLTQSVAADARAEIEQRTPLHRLGTVEDMVAAVRFLISPQSSFISGQVLAVDGGLTC